MKLLDTSYLVDYETGSEHAREYFEAYRDEPLAASTISMFELAFGVVWDGKRTLGELRESLSWVEFLDFSVEDTLEGANVQAELQATGDRIPIPDVMIAGTARNRGATIVATNSHFELVRGLEVERYR